MAAKAPTPKARGADTKAPDLGTVDNNTPSFKTAFEKRIGLSSDTLKKLFASDKPPAPNSKIKKLHDRIHATIKDGRVANFREFKTWAAVDAAYNIAFNQTTPTLINAILSRRLTAQETLDAFKQWGLSEDELFQETEQVINGAPTKVKTLNRQTFWKIFVPAVKSYTTVRTAKLFNDRNQYPFFKYEPVKYLEANRMRCEIITDMVQHIAHHYGLPSVLRQTILQCLLYSVAFTFPQEVWHYEEQKNDDGKVYTVKEGIRYTTPHPSRTFYDMSKPVTDFNTETGGDFAGYWRVLKWGDIEINSKYWNKDKINYGTNWFDPTISGTYFSELYPCTTKLYGGENLLWNADDNQSRERVMSIYTTSDHDKPVFLTDMFMRLKPVEWGLGDYKYNVWFRFVVASDSTVIWAEPLPYNPCLVMAYDVHTANARNPSFALEVLPWQDHIGNIFSQILLSIKQNVSKFVAYDSEQIGPDNIKELRTQQKDSSGILFFSFSSKKARVEQVDPSKMFIPVTFPQQNVAEMTNTINTVIMIMERLLGMSSQELGASGSHVQTAEEVKTISGNTSTRVDYTGSFVDEFIDAWKRQLFYGAKTYADPEFESHVAVDSEESIKILKDLGFVVKSTIRNRAHVAGKWSNLDYEAMVSTREGLTRTNQPQIAQTMMQSLQPVAPILAQNGAIQQLIDLYNRAAQMAGVPKDFRFSLPAPKPPPPPDPLRNLSERLNFKDLPDDVKLQFLAMLGFKVDPNAAPQAQAQQVQQAISQLSQQIQSGAVQQVSASMQPLVKEVSAQQQAEQQMQQQQSQFAQQLAQIEQQLKTLLTIAGHAAPTPRADALDTVGG